MGGGGGDDGAFEAQQQAIEDKKQAARDKLNLLFGVGGSTIGKPKAVDREQFMRDAPMAGNAPAADLPYGTPMAYSTSYDERGSTAPVMSRPQDNSYDERGVGGVAYGNAGSRVFDENGYNAALAQAQAEADGQSGEVNANKAARDALYQTVRDSAYTAGKRRVDEQNTDAKRKLKFELFARGLNGGSEDIDENAKRERTYTQGLMDLGAKADAAKAGFRSDDEGTRLQLLQSIDAGMDQGSALSSATNRMQVAADKAAADAAGTTVGDLFSNAGLIYDQGQMARGRQAGQADAFQMFPQSRRASSTTSGVTTRLPGE